MEANFENMGNDEIKCCETCKHVRETIIDNYLVCADPEQGCNNARCIGNMTLVCDNWASKDSDVKTIIIHKE
jgi:hypothetical protein